MAADLIVYKPVLTGLDIDAVAFVNATEAGDLCLNADGATVLLFENGATQEVIITVNSIKPCSHGQDHNSVCTIPVDKRRLIGPFDMGRFNDANGKIAISYGGAVLLLKVKAFSVQPTLI